MTHNLDEFLKLSPKKPAPLAGASSGLHDFATCGRVIGSEQRLTHGLPVVGVKPTNSLNGAPPIVRLSWSSGVYLSRWIEAGSGACECKF